MRARQPGGSHAAAFGIKAAVSGETLCLESRYRKLQRGVPQTIFYCPKCRGHRRRRHGCSKCEGFGKLTRTSVQELIARRALPTLRAKKGLFHGAGREDIDVLMLGGGRPFVFEVRESRQPGVDLDALRRDIVQRSEGVLELAPFRLVDRERVAFWKALHVDKVYRVRVSGSLPDDAPERLAGFDEIVTQQTPQRVVHRRADMARERRVEVLAAVWVEPTAAESEGVAADRVLELEIRCQHGTYVKEWVSGDEGRSAASVADRLGVAATCSRLDVLDLLLPDDVTRGMPEVEAFAIGGASPGASAGGEAGAGA